MKRIGLGIAAVAAVALVWWATAAVRRPQSPFERPRAAAPAAGGVADAPARRAAPVGAEEPSAPVDAPPGSVRDTEIDGAVALDASGGLVVGPDLRRFLEYFFIASGEESDRQIAARIALAIDTRLTGDAARDAHGLFERFLRYRARAETLAGTAPDDVEARFAALRRLRVEVFGEADAAALFADEEALFAAALAERRIRADPSLSDAERAAQLAALDTQLPAEVHDARAAATAPLRLADDEAALRAAGGSDADIRALREQAVGAEAADRLAALDHQRAAWQARVDAYRVERGIIDAEAGLDQAQRAAAIAALRSRHFSGPELLRIEALDRIQGSRF